MPHQGVAHPLAEQHPTAHHHPADRSVGRGSQQETDLGDDAAGVDSYRYRVDVHQRHLRTDLRQALGRQPGRVGLGVDVAHGGHHPRSRPVATDDPHARRFGTVTAWTWGT